MCLSQLRGVAPPRAQPLALHEMHQSVTNRLSRAYTVVKNLRAIFEATFFYDENLRSSVPPPI